MRGYVYILKCSTGEYYVGATRYPLQRLREHYRKRGAVFTKKRHPVEVVYITEVGDMDEEFKFKDRLDRMGLEHLEKSYRPTFNAKEMHDKVVTGKRRIDPLAFISNWMEHMAERTIPLYPTKT